MPTRMFFFLVSAAFLMLASPGRTEIYKCQTPDGKTLFTTQRSECPGAKAHVIKGRVHSIEHSVAEGSARPPARRSSAARFDEDAGREAMWREKKARSHRQPEEAAQRLATVRKAVGWCNRGHDLYTENQSGIRSNYSCSDVHREFEELARTESELRAYLDGGLEEDCRRSGCLPGWIR